MVWPRLIEERPFWPFNPNSEIEKGSAPAPGAVFRALAENTGRTKRCRVAFKPVSPAARNAWARSATPEACVLPELRSSGSSCTPELNSRQAAKARGENGLRSYLPSRLQDFCFAALRPGANFCFGFRVQPQARQAPGSGPPHHLSAAGKSDKEGSKSARRSR